MTGADLRQQRRARGYRLSLQSRLRRARIDFGRHDAAQQRFDIGRLRDGKQTVGRRRYDDLTVQTQVGRFSVFAGDIVQDDRMIAEIKPKQIPVRNADA